MQKDEEQLHTVRIPIGLAKALIVERTLKNKYETNSLVRIIDFYACLKSTNTCGVIKDFTKQLESLLRISKVGRSTFYNRLKECQNAGLLIHDENAIRLVSWRTVCTRYNVKFQGYHTLNYSIEGNERIQHIITAIALKEHRTLMQKQVDKHITENPDIRLAFELYAKHFIGTTAELTPTALYRAQQLSFANGAPQAIYEALHSINPDTNITVKTIQRMHGMKSHRSATYLKRVLHKTGIAQITKRTPTQGSYLQKVASSDPPPAQTSAIVNLMHISKEECMRLTKLRKKSQYRTWYVRGENKRVWFHPDKISFNKNLFSANAQ